METTNSQTEVSMRGFNQAISNKIIVLINGRSTYVDLIGSTYTATLPIGVEDIERIEVVRGPGSALYGANAFNGVINIITKAAGEGKSGFSAAYGDHNAAHGSMYGDGARQGSRLPLQRRVRQHPALEPRGRRQPSRVDAHRPAILRISRPRRSRSA